jgi:hypothetical protein
LQVIRQLFQKPVGGFISGSYVALGVLGLYLPAANPIIPAMR